MVILVVNLTLNVALEVSCTMRRDREALFRLEDALENYKAIAKVRTACRAMLL